MLVLKTSAAISNPNAPLYEQDPEAEALLALGPTLWLEADERFVVKSGSNVEAWVDRVGGRRYVPGSSNRPTLVTAGSKSGVRFSVSPMVPQGGFETFTSDGTHTMVVLFRMDAPSGELATPGGYLVGSNGTSHNYMNAFNYTSGSLDIASGGVALNGYSTDLRDGQWHLMVLSVPSTPGSNTSSVLRIDGAEVQSFPGQKPPTASGFRQLILGAHGSGPYSVNLQVGQIGGVMYLPGKAVHQNGTQLAALEDYWLARRTERLA